MKTNVISGICLLLLLGITAFLESPQSIKLDNLPAANTTMEPTDTFPSNVPILEERLVDTKEVNGYRVETYQEFEVKKNEDGEVIESKPTDNFEYIRYQIE